jgi:hypothetical protein
MHPFKNFVNWEHSWRTWLPLIVLGVIVLFLAAELFDPGCANGC